MCSCFSEENISCLVGFASIRLAYMMRRRRICCERGKYFAVRLIPHAPPHILPSIMYLPLNLKKDSCGYTQLTVLNWYRPGHLEFGYQPILSADHEAAMELAGIATAEPQTADSLFLGSPHMSVVLLAKGTGLPANAWYVICSL